VVERRASRRCGWCGRGFAAASAVGRLPTYCKRSCRQRAFEARRRSAELGLGESELVITRDELHRLQDQLWILECAIQDVERDLAASATLRDHREAMAWLLEAARPLVALKP
jgi:hypothetical protein